MIQWLGITLLDIGHARALLTAWTNAPGNPKPVPSYGLNFLSPTWTQEDGIVLNAFAVWWNGSGYAPKVPLGQGTPLQAELTAEHLSALDKWSAGAVPLPPVIDIPASKALLVLWGKTDGSGLVAADYGVQPQDLAPTWSARDAAALTAFAKWANSHGQGPLTEVGILNTDKSIALKQWFIERSSKIPGGWVPPPATQPKSPPAKLPPPPPPLPEPGPNADKPPPAAPAKADNTMVYVLGGVLVAVIGGLWIWMARTPRAAAPPQANPSQIWSAPKTKRERRLKLHDIAVTSRWAPPSTRRASMTLDGWRAEGRVSEVEYIELRSMLAELGHRIVART